MKDLQSFIEENKDNILCIKKQVKLDQISSLVAQAKDTILFENIEGYPGYKLIDLLFATRKSQSRVLNCEPTEVVKRLAEIVRTGPKPLTHVDNAICQEVIYEKSEVDLTKIPVVTHTDYDLYPYTTSFVVQKDPENGKYNQMFPRCGVLNKNEMVSSFVTPTANTILAKHREAGTKMPQALVIGAHPGWELAGCYSHPHDDWWEFELFETITGSPGLITKCKTVDLVVPADASIIIEGYVSPNKTAIDGPNPGPTMLFTPYQMQQPVFEITAITMRKDPIYRHHQTTPFTDHQEMPRLFHEAILYERLRAMGLKVHDVHFPQGGGSLGLLIQVEPVMDGQIVDALLAVLGSPWMNTKMAIAVDPDIDIYDYRDVFYALATRVDPSKNVIRIDGARGVPFDPSAEPVNNAWGNTAQTRLPSIVGKWGIDATKPVPYREARRKDFERAWPMAWGHVKLEDYIT